MEEETTLRAKSILLNIRGERGDEQTRIKKLFSKKTIEKRLGL